MKKVLVTGGRGFIGSKFGHCFTLAAVKSRV